ncbi:nucleotidyl transferase AbiEii/AbiGii toxin family protein [Candidatus Micrarchaeota archaeon]|nr:nucleotidyl transferase AbiEii/AbiGii toxin family protein [Candidatus Micrarchaeota archaeon]
MQEFIRKRINEVAVLLGLRKDLLYKEYHLHFFLEDLRNAFPRYCLNGGTALNKVYSGAPRFSEDVDCEFEGLSPKEVGSVISGLERKVSGPRTMVGGRLLAWTVFFRNEVSGREDKLEFHAQFVRSFCSPVEEKRFDSLLNIVSVAPLRRDDLLRPVRARTYGAEGLLAEKLCTIAGRTEGKDYYDAMRLFEKGVSAQKVRSAVSHVDAEFDWAALVDRISATDVESLRAQDPFIPAPFAPDWRALKRTLAAKVAGISPPG